MEVTLFATCLVHQLAPGVGRACVEVLEKLGHTVRYHPDEPCCGQFAYNAGYRETARKLARRFVERFSNDGLIVTPSGSCASMIRNNYEVLLAEDPELHPVYQELKGRIFELSQFVDAFEHRERISGRVGAVVYYHPSCHLHRELGVTDEPVRLLQGLDGITLRRAPALPACCGFGGAFSVKFAEVSQAILDMKIDSIVQSGADIVTAGDMGCLVHIWGGLRRKGIKTRVLHIAEILANHIEDPSLP